MVIFTYPLETVKLTEIKLPILSERKVRMIACNHFEKARFLAIILSQSTAPIFITPQFSPFFPWAGHFAGRYMDAADRHVVGGVPVDWLVFSVGPGTFLRANSLTHSIPASRRTG
jgi:hypothetical protein